MRKKQVYFSGGFIAGPVTHRLSKGLNGPVIVIIALLLLSFSVTYFLNSGQPASSGGSGIKKFSSYAELESYVKESADAYGYYGGGIAGGMMATAKSAISESSDSAAPPVSGSPDYSRTNVQVEGVDEADIVKSDGKYIYAVAGNKVAIVDAYPAQSAKNVSEIDFNGSVSEIFINGDRLVLFGQKYESFPGPVPTEAAAEKMIARPDMYPRYSQKTTVAIYDVSDRANPVLAGEISIDGNYYDSRMADKYVYVVANEPAYYAYAQDKNVTVPGIYYQGRAVSQAFPDIYYFDGVAGNVYTTIAAINLDSPEDVSSKVILTNYAQNMYVSEKNIYIIYNKWMSEADYVERVVDIILPLVPQDVREKINAAMALEVSKQTKMQAVGEIVQGYMSKLSASERESLEESMRAKMEVLQADIEREREKTFVQKISIDGGNIEYVAGGDVPGTVLNQFSMDEYNGYFRIATTTSGNRGVVPMTGIASSGVTAATAQRAIAAEKAEAAGSASDAKDAVASSSAQATPSAPVAPPQQSGPLNNIYVLDERLNVVGKLQDLAPGERIYSARFLGDRAYLVTFRQVDPLFVIDLSVPQSPEVLGYLKISGVSDYLHPYDETHVIGVGRDATDEGRINGIKVSLFDASDVANPKEISKYVIGGQGTYSEALYDHKAFLFSKEKNLLVIPVSITSFSEAPQISAQQPEYWQGAYVFSIDLNSGITLKGKITHANETNPKEYYYDYLSQIRRSLYLDNVLYTISQKMIMMNALDTDALSEINSVALPGQEHRLYANAGIAE